MNRHAPGGPTLCSALSGGPTLCTASSGSPIHSVQHRQEAVPKNISTCIEELKRAKNLALVTKSSLWEGIFLDDKGVN